MTERSDYVLQTYDMKKYFDAGRSFFGHSKQVKAVDGVDICVRQDETVGLVGESGCGKSTIARLVLKLKRVTDGKIFFDGKDITFLKKDELREIRKDMQVVFQDPYSSLNGRQSVHTIVSAPLYRFKIGTAKEKEEITRDILERVGLRASDMLKYPHQLSGGQRQRVAIARAIILHPKFVVCDEPVSALDVSVRSQVLNLMKDLQDSFKMSYLFISHDLSTVYYLCDRVYVMYLGRIVEEGSKEEIFSNPLHPYTRVLLSAIPQPVVGIKKNEILLTGDNPSPVDIPSGCRFRTRCPFADETCKACDPALMEVGADHKVACLKFER